MTLAVEFTCPQCKDSITVSWSNQMMGVGLFMSHLVGEHWEAVQKMHADLGSVTPGAWKRIAEGLR